MLFRSDLQGVRLRSGRETMEAYDVFTAAAETHALKVVLEGERAVREIPAALAGTTA